MSPLLLILALSAQDDPAPRIEACETQANTMELNKCGAARLALERARMDRYLTAARASMTAYQQMTPAEYEIDLAAFLETSQSTFEAYAEAQCATVHGMHISGTIRGIMYLGCMEGMLHQRTRRIWSDFLADNEEPLEEPIEPAAAAILGD